jgi:hypothetical protein
MAKKSIRGDILEIARVLREFSARRSDEDWRAFRPSFPMGADARLYAEAAREATKPADLEALVKASFRPFFLANGLTQASLLKRHADRAFLLEALATGLVEFADYFEGISPDRIAPDETPEEFERLAALQRRYFAYCVAQLSECGMGMEGIWMTMKGDSLDMETSYAVRAILEEGPEKIAASPLYSDEEKRLWAAAYAQTPGAFQELQRLLVETHKLPFKKSPAS